MSDSPAPDLKARLSALLQSNLSDLDLAARLDALAQENAGAFQRLADVWALPLYERDPLFFQTFILANLDENQQTIIHDLLIRTERDGYQEFFSALYNKVATVDSWNADVIALARSDKSDDEVLRALTLRHTWNRHIREAAALALYRRNPEKFKRIIIDSLPYAGPQHVGQFVELRRLAARRRAKGDDDLYRELFRRFATAEEWHIEARRLIATTPLNRIRQTLDEFRPRHIESDLPLELVESLLGKYKHSDEIRAYLERTSPEYARRIIERELARLGDNPPATLVYTAIMGLQQRLAWQTFRANADLWMPFVYDHAPDQLEYFAHHHVQGRHSAMIDSLLKRAKADKRHGLFRVLYRIVAGQPGWNADVLELARSAVPDSEVRAELDRMDIRHFVLNDQAAAALYRRSPALFRDYIWDHLGRERGKHNEFLLAVEESGDAGFFQLVFRRIAGREAWERQIERILTQDIPADQIVDELNKWHLNAMPGVNRDLLNRLLARYREAVLPYFERALNWASESRLRSLLALDIERGALLRELAAIASRQPREFTAQARVWALPLYERGPDFFGSFLVRYLDRSQEYVIRQLLPLMERDGKTKLYRDLYERYIREDEWQHEIRKLIETLHSDDELERALARRDVRFMRLPDSTALLLYERDPERFRGFIKNHLTAGRWWRWAERQEPFNRLRAAAEKRADRDLLNALASLTDSARNWRHEAEALLHSDIPPAKVAAALEAIHPQRDWEVSGSDILIDFVDRYGEAVMPYVLKHTRWIKPHDRLLRSIRAIGDKALYWRAYFQIGEPARWNDELRNLLNSAYSEEAFFTELGYMLPEQNVGGRWMRWQVSADLARLIYERYPKRARPFLESYLAEPDLALFHLAEGAGDEEFLNYIAYRLLFKVNSHVYTLNSRWHDLNAKKNAQRQIEILSEPVLRRFERLYTASPESYVRGAASILVRFRAFAFDRWSDPGDKNPIWTYLATKHHDAWARSREAMLDLLESPSIHVQLVGLTILGEGGPDAAARTVENLASLRAILLGRARSSTKRLALRCLNEAARSNPAYAARIMPVLDDIIDFRAKRSIAEDVMVTYAKLKRLGQTINA